MHQNKFDFKYGPTFTNKGQKERAVYHQRERPVISSADTGTTLILLKQNTTLLSKVRQRFFQSLWPSQKTQTLPGTFAEI